MNEVLAMAVSPAAVPAVPLDTHPDGRGSSEKGLVLVFLTHDDDGFFFSLSLTFKFLTQ